MIINDETIMIMRPTVIMINKMVQWCLDHPRATRMIMDLIEDDQGRRSEPRFSDAASASRQSAFADRS